MNIIGMKGKGRNIFIVAIIVIVGGFLFFDIYGSFAKPSYSFSGNNLSISGQYDVKINLSGAAAAHLLHQVPATPVHTNGAAIGSTEKGYFTLSDSTVYLNIMDENTQDYILITDRGGSKYYINCASPKETDELFKKVSAHEKLTK